MDVPIRVVVLLNSVGLCSQEFDGEYATLNVGDSGDNIPVTYRTSGSKMVISWKESGVCEGSTDLKTWFGVAKGRRYNLKTINGHAFYRVKKERPRTAKTYIPKGYNPDNKYPLIINLHGYTGNAEHQNGYFPLRSRADLNGFIFCIPEGLKDSGNQQRWNAIDACCGSRNDLADDSKYLRNLIQTVMNKYSVDKNHIYCMGFSNGAMMSYRMAIDHSDILAGIIVISGISFKDKKYAPKFPINVLHIHGTTDSNYNGTTLGQISFYFADTPSVEENIKNWAEYSNCNEMTMT